MRVRAIVVCILILAACTVSRLMSSSTQLSSTPILYTETAQYDAMAWIRGGERFPQGSKIIVFDKDASRPLAPDFFATADPNVSFDGKSVIFAGRKKKSDPWQIWEIAVESGSEPHRIITTPADVVRPMYLPDDWMVYARKQNGHFTLEAASLSGGQSHSLFFAPGNALPTDVLRDGRILFETSYPLGSGSTPELYTVYSDGSGVESYRCDHGPARYAGKQISSGDIVFTHGSGLGRFTSPLAHGVEIVVPRGEYAGDVAETQDNAWLLSWRSGPGKKFELKLRTSAGTTTNFLAVNDNNLVQPTVLGPRPIPNRHPSALHEWQTANLLTLNAYTSKYRFADGSISSVRVYTQDAAGNAKVLGVAPVEKDGSLFIKVPGDQPLKFELLDALGHTLKKQEGWMWTRKGEQRICVGCHTGPERAPDNAVPAILLRSTTPADLSGTTAETSTGGH